MVPERLYPFWIFIEEDARAVSGVVASRPKCNSAVALRSAGYNATHGACILFYENPKGIEALRNHEVKMINLFTLSDMLDVAEEHETHPLHLIKAYRNFLRDPLGWQAERGLKRVETGGTK